MSLYGELMIMIFHYRWGIHRSLYVIIDHSPIIWSLYGELMIIIFHYTSTVLKSHQAGKVTSSPWHSGDCHYRSFPQVPTTWRTKLSRGRHGSSKKRPMRSGRSCWGILRTSVVLLFIMGGFRSHGAYPAW